MNKMRSFLMESRTCFCVDPPGQSRTASFCWYGEDRDE